MSNCKIPIYFPCTYVFITHATSCRGYNVLDPSVSPMYFIVSASLLEPLNRISRNFLVMKNIFCRCRTCAYIQDVLIHFFSWSYPLFEILPKLNILQKYFVPATRLKLFNRISWKVVVDKDIMCIYAHSQEVMMI